MVIRAREAIGGLVVVAVLSHVAGYLWCKSRRRRAVWRPGPPGDGGEPVQLGLVDPLLEDIHDVELPGMWEQADFMGGSDYEWRHSS